MIYNTTDKEIEITLRELATGEEFKIKILPQSSVEIEKGYILVDPDISSAPIEEDIEEKENIIEPIEEAPEVEEASEIEEPEIIVEEPEVLKEQFICEICGQEFASARSLSSHKSRVHKD